MGVPSRDERMIAVPVDGADEAKLCVTLCEEVDQGMEERVDKDLKISTKVFCAVVAEI